MKKWKVRSALIALVVLLAGCSSNAQYNSSTSGNVGTAWGGDVHSSVQGVSAERAWRDPAEMIVISYSTNVPSGYDRVGNDSNLLIVFYVQIMPDDFVMQLHRF